ncbi:winged helix-turn-helix domain-containing protein [Acrocarpospora sp. B8E8]|uniref:GntR family transcriptional regulator n=1 Tax=Acrocarpospora sp. B8E8 TaxID=3153572 RepID=UPI00325CCEF8
MDWHEAKIDPTSKTRVHIQIADIFEKSIANGFLAPGAAIPSENELMDVFAVSRTTARRVAAVLREREVIHTVPGKGSFAGREGGPNPPDVRPLPRRVADQIGVAILSGKYPAGSRLPAERDLTCEHGVARPTLRKALVILRTEGWAFTVPFAGTFIASPRCWPKKEAGVNTQCGEAAFEAAEITDP